MEEVQENGVKVQNVLVEERQKHCSERTGSESRGISLERWQGPTNHVHSVDHSIECPVRLNGILLAN